MQLLNRLISIEPHSQTVVQNNNCLQGLANIREPEHYSADLNPSHRGVWLCPPHNIRAATLHH